MFRVSVHDNAAVSLEGRDLPSSVLSWGHASSSSEAIRRLRCKFMGAFWRKPNCKSGLTPLATLTLSRGSPFPSLLVCVRVLKTHRLPRPSEPGTSVTARSTALGFHVLQATQFQRRDLLGHADNVPPPNALPGPSRERPGSVGGTSLAKARVPGRNHPRTRPRAALGVSRTALTPDASSAPSGPQIRRCSPSTVPRDSIPGQRPASAAPGPQSRPLAGRRERGASTRPTYSSRRVKNSRTKHRAVTEAGAGESLGWEHGVRSGNESGRRRQLAEASPGCLLSVLPLLFGGPLSLNSARGLEQ